MSSKSASQEIYLLAGVWHLASRPDAVGSQPPGVNPPWTPSLGPGKFPRPGCGLGLGPIPNPDYHGSRPDLISIDGWIPTAWVHARLSLLGTITCVMAQ